MLHLRSHSVALISVGNELLIGKTVNTNHSWLARRLTILGYEVKVGLTVRDVCEDIEWAFRTAVELGCGVVISTGGLGPTFDDMTVACMAKAFGLPLVKNEEALRMIEEKYSAKGLPLTEHRVKMAMLPEGGRPLPNRVGTAPGVLLEHGGVLAIALPGVPAEMKAIFEDHVEPILRERGPPVRIAEKFLRSTGVPESSAAPVIDRAMKVSPRVYVKSHPAGGELTEPVLKIHIQASADSVEEAREIVERAAEVLRAGLTELGARVEEVNEL
ncbi:MAG: competence damage-inducible protein A [Thermoproteota archaeon]|nr:MAG: competence damage-inducible protein A [Candidatus Korarchaeota archaeon]